MQATTAQARHRVTHGLLLSLLLLLWVQQQLSNASNTSSNTPSQASHQSCSLCGIQHLPQLHLLLVLLLQEEGRHASTANAHASRCRRHQQLVVVVWLSSQHEAPSCTATTEVAPANKPSSHCSSCPCTTHAADCYPTTHAQNVSTRRLSSCNSSCSGVVAVGCPLLLLLQALDVLGVLDALLVVSNPLHKEVAHALRLLLQLLQQRVTTPSCCRRQGLTLLLELQEGQRKADNLLLQCSYC